MSTAALNDALVLLLKTFEGLNKLLNGGDKLILKGDDGRDVHCGGEGIVGGLAHIDVVVGMEQLLIEDLVRAVGNNLVGVHIGLGAASGLLVGLMYGYLIVCAMWTLAVITGGDIPFLREDVLQNSFFYGIFSGIIPFK